MNKRLSGKQREVLTLIRDTNTPIRLNPLSDKLSTIPFYLPHLDDWFTCESALNRFIGNLEMRGFISQKDRYFLLITDAGKSALEVNQRES